MFLGFGFSLLQGRQDGRRVRKGLQARGKPARQADGSAFRVDTGQERGIFRGAWG